MQIRVLGNIGVVDPGGVALGGPTQRRVLAALVLDADRVVSVDQLVDAVWPDGDVPERAGRCTDQQESWSAGCESQASSPSRRLSISPSQPTSPRSSCTRSVVTERGHTSTPTLAT